MLLNRVTNTRASLMSAPARLIGRYAMAVVFVSASFVLRSLLIRYFGEQMPPFMKQLPPFIICYPVIMLVALLGGLGPGLLATALGVLGTAFFIMSPNGNFAVANSLQAAALALFAATGIFMSLVAERYRRSQRLIVALREQQALQKSKNELRKASEYKQIALDAAGMGLWEMRTDSGAVSGDDNCRKLFGIPREDFLLMDTFLNRIHPEDRATVDCTVKLAMAGADGALWGTEYRVVWPDGSIHWIASYGQTFADSERRMDRLVGVSMDITERKRVEAALKKSEIEHRLLFEQIPDGIFISDSHGRFTDVNSAGVELFGYAPDEWCNLTIPEILDAEEVQRLPHILACFAAGGVANLEIRHKRKDGSAFEGSVTGRQLSDGRLVAIVRDITERIKVEHALHQSMKQLQIFVEHAPAALAMFDSKMQYLCASRRWLEDYGLGDRDLQGQSHYDVFPEIPERWKDAHRRGLAGEVLHEEADRFYRADGTSQWLTWKVVPWHDESGCVGGIVVFTEDVTDRLVAEQMLRENEIQFQTLANSIPQLCWMANPDGSIFWYNQRWYEYTGTTPEQMEGWGWQSVMAPEAVPNVMAQIENAIGSKSSCELTYPLKGADGVFRSFLTLVVPIFDADGQVVRWIGTNTDIDQQKKVEAELRNSNARLDLALEVAELGELDVDLKKLTAAPSLRRDQIFGYETLQLVWNNETFLSHVLPEDRADFEERLRASSRVGIWNLETRIRRLDGKIRWIWIHGRGMSYDTEKPTRMYGFIKDITQEKRAEEERKRLLETVQQERDTLSALIGAMNDEVWLIDAEKRIALVNPAALSIFGSNYAPNVHIEELGKGIEFRRTDGSLRPLEESPPLRALRGEVIRSEEEILRIPATGEVRYRELNTAPIRDAAGTIIGSLVVVHDITRRKSAETHIRQLNRVYSVLSEINQTIVREKDSQAMLEAACRIAVEKGEFRMAWIGMIDPVIQQLDRVASSGFVDRYLDRVKIDLLDPNSVGGPVEQCVRTGGHAICNDIEHELLRPWKNDALQNGYRSLAAFPLQTEGKVVGVFCLYASEPAFFDEGETRLLDELVTDISFALEVNRHEKDRKLKEEELRRLNRVYSILSNVNRTIIREKDSAVILQTACHIAVDVGRFQMAWIGMIDEPGRQLKPVASAGNVDGYLDKVRIDLLDQASARGPASRCIESGRHAICDDIQDDSSFLSWRDEALRRGYRSSAALPLSIGGQVVGVLNLYASEAGFFKEDETLLLGKMAKDISFALEVNRHEADRKKMEENLRWQTAFFRAQVDSALDGVLVVDPAGKKILQNQRLNDLFKIPASISSDSDDAPQFKFVTQSMKDPQQFAEKVNYLASHPEAVSHDQLDLADGSIFERYSYPVRDKALNYYGRIWTFRDITERRRLEDQFRQMQKMEAVGQLTGGIAHDFNNLLAVIIGNLDLLERQIHDNEAAVKRVNTARNASLRGANLTRRLLAFARQEKLQPADLDLNTVIKTVLALAAPALGPTIQVNTRLDPSIPHVFADASGLENALLNLVVNARDAMTKGGKLTVTSELRTLEAGQFLGEAHELDPGRYAFVTLSDTGHGMTKQISKKIFEPFFTTKSHGTGLGLAMVYGFFKQSGGTVRVYSEPGIGTTLSLFLPIVEGGAKLPSTPTPETQSPDVTTGTILVVDDEADVLEIASTCLSDLGYTVLTATDSLSAIQVLEGRDDIRVLLTDILMPGGMNGVELAHRAIAIHSDLRVIYCSGFPADALGERDLSVAESSLLRKPYQRSELMAIVREVLAAEAPSRGDRDPTSNTAA